MLDNHIILFYLCSHLSSKGSTFATVALIWKDEAVADLGYRDPNARRALVSPLGHYDPSVDGDKTLF